MKYITRYKRIYLTSALIVMCISLLIPAAVSAHTLKIDGSIGIIMHIDPDDDPIAQAPATVYFYLKDDTSKLDLTKCNCTVSIQEGSTTLYSETTSSGKDIKVDAGSLTISTPFIFPEKAVYSVVIQGAPVAGAAFQPFALEYDVRVDRIASPATQPSFIQSLLSEHAVHIIIFGGGLIVGIVLTLLDKGKRKKQEQIINK